MDVAQVRNKDVLYMWRHERRLCEVGNSNAIWKPQNNGIKIGPNCLRLEIDFFISFFKNDFIDYFTIDFKYQWNTIKTPSIAVKSISINEKSRFDQLATASSSSRP